MRIIDDARICLIFFTRLPVTWPEDLPRERITRAFQAAPVAGLVTGMIGALTYGLAMWLFNGSVHVAATLAVASQVVTTGAFHEDGFADFFDGVGGGKGDSDGGGHGDGGDDGGDAFDSQGPPAVTFACIRLRFGLARHVSVSGGQTDACGEFAPARHLPIVQQF